MIEHSPFAMPFALLVLVLMQYICAFLAWRFRRPLLPIISTGLLTGGVVGAVFHQALPGAFGLEVSIIFALITALTYCALMRKVYATFLRR